MGEGGGETASAGYRNSVKRIGQVFFTLWAAAERTLILPIILELGTQRFVLDIRLQLKRLRREYIYYADDKHR